MSACERRDPAASASASLSAPVSAAPKIEPDVLMLGGAPVPRVDPPPTQPPAPSSHKPAPEKKAQLSDPDLDPIDAAQAGKIVIDLVSGVNGGHFKVIDAGRQGSLFKIVYSKEKDSSFRRTAWVSRDGAWATMGLVDIGTRTENLRLERIFMDCLIQRGLRVFLDPSQEAGVKQLQALGAFADRVVVDCAGPRAAHCAALGYTSLPVFVYDKGVEVGLRDSKWIRQNLGCVPRQIQELATPPKVVPGELGERVWKLYSRVSREPVDLGAVWQDGVVWHVSLLYRGARPRVARVTVSQDGRWVLVDAIEVAREREAQELRLRFAGCLAKVGARLYYDSEVNKGMAFLYRRGLRYWSFAVNCRDKAHASQCAKAQIARFPTVVIGKRRLEAPFLPPDIEAFSGCK